MHLNGFQCNSVTFADTGTAAELQWQRQQQRQRYTLARVCTNCIYCSPPSTCSSTTQMPVLNTVQVVKLTDGVYLLFSH